MTDNDLPTQQDIEMMADELLEFDMETRIKHTHAALDALVKAMALAGISARIDRQPLQPLAMGNAVPVVHTQPARHQPTPAPQERPISDREWAAQPANLREGCTTHVPGVGDL